MEEQNLDNPIHTPQEVSEVQYGESDKWDLLMEDSNEEDSSDVEEIEEPSDEAKPDEKDGDEETGDDDTEGEEEESSEKDDDSDGRDKGDKQEAKGTKRKEFIPPIKVKQGDKFTEIDPTGTIRKKIDGKFETFTVQDAVNAFTRQKDADSKYNEANSIKQKYEHEYGEFQKDYEHLKNTATSFFKHVQSGRPRDALYEMAKLTGQDPDKVWEDFQEIQEKNAEQLRSMTPEQMKQWKIEQELEFYKNRDKLEKDQQNQQSEEEQRLAPVKELLEKRTLEYNINRDEILEAKTWFLQMKDAGLVNIPDDFFENPTPQTVEFLVQRVNDTRLLGTIQSKVKEHLPEFAENEQFLYNMLVETKQHSLTEEDWIDILNDAKGQLEEETTSEQIARKKSKSSKSKSKPSPSKKNEDADEEYEDFLDFDEIG